MNSTTDTAKILIVDDDPLNLQLVARVLSRAGFDTATAPSGEDALAWLWLEHFDAVISDVIMPRMSGFELLQNIRSSRPWLPVILMSSLDQEDIRNAALAGGAAAIFEKPVDRAALVAAVRAAICNQGRRSAKEDVTSLGTQ